ncbi:MAG: MBL fold metallo-hydrolase [Phycisphaerae bacterium]|nr:MBL fold metallo-hydrolase [Phycisphaerae bacterium]
MNIQFLGATRQVTGSRYFLEVDGFRMLVDCGMFQERDHLGRNWEPSPIAADTIDYVLLTHAHLDHCGLLPRLVGNGFNGTILTTPASKDLAEIILKDSAHIQEEDAAYKLKRHKKENRTGPYPVKPLYTAAEVQATLPLFDTAPYDKPTMLSDSVTVTYHDAGHILGSAMLEMTVRRNGDKRTVIFSGDVGERDKPIVRDPSVFERADYVVMESTYGARNHKDAGPIEDQLCDIINKTVHAGGNVVIPTFAVERAQELLYYMGRLVREDRIPHVQVFLDSPMAVDVTEVFRRHRECMDDEARQLVDAGEPPCRFPGLRLSRSTSESKSINSVKGPSVIMSTAGMCNAGRIKHHLINNISRPECTIVFVGYQAYGTLGRQIVEGKKRVRIHGKQRRVKARVAQVHGLSAHADQDGLLDWIGHLNDPPRRVFLTHGEENAATALADRIRSKWDWAVEIPGYRDEYGLD